MTLTIGAFYSRREIHQALGGELESYLPQRDGRIVCACLTEKLGPDVPNKVLVGDASKVIEKANLLLTQSEPIPVFIKIAKNRWQFVGEYRASGFSTSPLVINQEEVASGRQDVVMVLYLRRVEDLSQHYLLYWRSSTAHLNVGGILDHIASDQLKPSLINLGDTIWIVTTYDGCLFLLGRMIVGKIIEGQKEAEQEWDKGPLWEAKFHIGPEPGTEEIVQEIEIADLVFQLRFKSKGADHLKVVRGRVNAQQLQRVRRLTDESSALLETRWVNYTYESNEKDVSISAVGAGYGDAAKNKEVEQAAVACVRRLYESQGWYVESVEAKKIGFDLLCKKGANEDHVEVKGVQGTGSAFILTEGEFQRAKQDSAFVLYVVTSALTDYAESTRYTAKELLKRFAFSPISYRAVLKE